MDPTRTAQRLPRAVFFDVGDTLLDTSAMLDSALYTALVPLDPTRTIDDVRRAVAASGATLPVKRPPFHEVKDNAAWWIDRYRRVGEALGLDATALERFIATVGAGHFGGDPLVVVPDAPAALARLAALGIPLGVISNWDDTLEAILERKGLRRFFRACIASTAIHRAKPDRAIFAHALAQLGVAASDAWHVGDDPDADARGAARAGMRAVLLDPHGMYARMEGGPIARARTLTEAVDRILA
jgi:FMN phosphatase YigB (HAD superfamily)